MKATPENKNIHAGHRQRLRQNILNHGLDGLHDHQVLEYVLNFIVPQKDTNDLAHALINKFHSFSGVLEANISQLKSVKGVGEVVATFLHNFCDIYHYYQKCRINDIKSIKNTREAINYLTVLLGDKNHEEIYLIGLDPKNNVVFTQKLTSGGVNDCNINIREITDLVIQNNVFNIVVGHNHPKGKSNPSAEDDKFTRALSVSMTINNVYVLDHIIVGQSDYYSYFATNKLAEYRKEFDQFLVPAILAQNKAGYEVEQ